MTIEYMGYHIQPVKNMPTSYEVIFPGKGKMPNLLSGIFTSTGLAKTQIDKYLRIGSHAQTVSKGGD